MSSDDPFGQNDGGGDWGDDPEPLRDDDNIDMNYGQPLPSQDPGSNFPPAAGGGQPPGGNMGQPAQAPSQPPQPGNAPQPGGQPGGGFNQSPNAMQPSSGNEMQSKKGKMETEDIVALVVTFFIPGVGHMLLGQVKKGLVILAGTYLTCGAGYILTILFAVDAYLVAMTRKYRQVDEWEIFPDSKDHLGIG